MSGIEDMLAERAEDIVTKAVLETRWPNGDFIDGITVKTAKMIAQSVVDGLREAGAL